MSFIKKAIGKVANFAGDIFSTVTGQKSANEMAQNQFDAQMDTSIQRRVADGLKAGINPLAAIGASANVSPTIHAGGPNGSDPMSLFSLFGSAAKGLKNMFVQKQEDDMAYDSEAKFLDLEGKRLENRILRNRALESEQNLKTMSDTGSAKEVPSIEPNRRGERALFVPAYDLKGRPRLVANQDVIEGDNDNAGYRAAILTAIANGDIDKKTGKVVSPETRKMLDDMYFNMSGHHISNLDELYVSPTEMGLVSKDEAKDIYQLLHHWFGNKKDY